MTCPNVERHVHAPHLTPTSRDRYTAPVTNCSSISKTGLPPVINLKHLVDTVERKIPPHMAGRRPGANLMEHEAVAIRMEATQQSKTVLAHEGVRLELQMTQKTKACSAQ